MHTKDLLMMIGQREALLDHRERQLSVTASDADIPTKGPRGYNTEEVDRFIAASRARDMLKVIRQESYDDRPTMQDMWNELKANRQIMSEHYSLINDPEALMQRATEIREQYFRTNMTRFAEAALGSEFVPETFFREESSSKIDSLVVGHLLADGSYRAVQILPDGRVFSTDCIIVQDLKSANYLSERPIWKSHGTIQDLRIQIDVEDSINKGAGRKVRFTGFERRETPDGPEHLFFGNNKMNYFCDAFGNLGYSEADNIPNIEACRQRARERIWKDDKKLTKKVIQKVRPKLR